MFFTWKAAFSAGQPLFACQLIDNSHILKSTPQIMQNCFDFNHHHIIHLYSAA